MRKPELTLFYQFDPWNSSVGGIQTLINSFLKYVPQEFVIRFVGISADPSIEVGRWHTRELLGKTILFFPLFYMENDNVRGKIPTSVRYTLALAKRNFASDFMHFYRLEYSLATLNWSGKKMLFVQNDILEQVTPQTQTNTILWQRFPQLYFALERALLRQFDQILSCNENSASFYRQQYPVIAERVTYFTNTVDTAVFQPLLTEEKEARRIQRAKQLNLPESSQFILFAGRLHPQKDPVLLIQAMAELNMSDAHLLIAGDGELGDAVRDEIARLGVGHRVTLLGAIDQASLLSLYQIANLFILTSVYEGLPFAALEALACGVPIVTTQAGDLPKVMTPQNGIVCQDRLPSTIAEAMTNVLQSPQKFPVSDCVRAVTPYSAENVIGKVYTSMLSTWPTEESSMEISGISEVGVN